MSKRKDWVQYPTYTYYTRMFMNSDLQTKLMAKWVAHTFQQNSARNCSLSLKNPLKLNF